MSIFPPVKSAIDYRSFLQLEFEKRVTVNPRYSLRAFARDLKLSASRLSEIFAQKNGLSTKNAARIAELICVDQTEREWFYYSVSAQHARSERERKSSQLKLQSLKEAPTKRILSQEEFKVIAHWYHFAILELLSLKNFTLTATNVSKQLGISQPEASAAIERLKNLQWIREENGQWTTKESYRAVSSPTPSMAIRGFHNQLLSKAEKAIHQQNMNERSLHSLIFPTDTNRTAEATQELEDFCYRFNEKFSSGAQRGEKLYALTLQFFKITQDEVQV